MRISDWSSDVCSSDPVVGYAVRPTENLRVPDLAVVIMTDIIRFEIESEVCARLPFERAAQIDVLLAAMRMDNIWCRIEIKIVNLVIAASDAATQSVADRSEEHTTELQSITRISYAVFCLKKKNT